jgi:hypothetical protein
MPFSVRVGARPLFLQLVHLRRLPFHQQPQILCGISTPQLVLLAHQIGMAMPEQRLGQAQLGRMIVVLRFCCPSGHVQNIVQLSGW